MTISARRDPRSATLNSAISAAPATKAENALSPIVSTATATGQRRRHQSAIQPIAPPATRSISDARSPCWSSLEL